MLVLFGRGSDMLMAHARHSSQLPQVHDFQVGETSVEHLPVQQPCALPSNGCCERPACPSWCIPCTNWTSFDLYKCERRRPNRSANLPTEENVSAGICHLVVLDRSHHLRRISSRGNCIIPGLGCWFGACLGNWRITMFHARTVANHWLFIMAMKTGQFALVILILVTLITFAAHPTFVISIGISFAVSIFEQLDFLS